jgi:hypothetical protein
MGFFDFFPLGWVLGGMALLGLPVLLHLIMRQKPRRLPFPAFRFLRQRHIINRRRMRLQHLLLLLLRMALLAALCLALSQPRVFLPSAVAAWFGIDTARPAAAVFVFDVSHSMEYKVHDQTRLDQARELALLRFQELPENSRTAVVTTGDEGEEDWVPTAAEVRARINGLRVRPVQSTLPQQVRRACGLLAKATDAAERRLFVFSDRTATSWDADEAKGLEVPAGVEVVYVDLGVDEPKDLAIDKVEVEPGVVAAGGWVQVRALVRAVGADFDVKVVCQIDNEGDEHRLQLSAGRSEPVVFKLKAPTPPRPASAGDRPILSAVQATVKFTTPDDRPFKDALAHDNVRYATFQVRDDPKRQGRRVLVLADDVTAARPWKISLQAYESSHPAAGFQCERRQASDADKLGLDDLRPFPVVCLFQTAKPLPGKFWDALGKYVAEGGGLVIVPPGEELTDVATWNKPAEDAKLLPARLEKIVTAPNAPGAPWQDFDPKNPLTAPFAALKAAASHGGLSDFTNPDTQPYAARYWQVRPLADGVTEVASYGDGRTPPGPALVVRELGAGRVVQLTTVMDARQFERNRPWHNYWQASFGMMLVQHSCAYLAGDASGQELNFYCGMPVLLSLPPGAARGVYRLNAPDPDLTESEKSLIVGDTDASLEVRTTAVPGNYSVFDPGGNVFTAFSLNVRPEEAQLGRLPVGAIEGALGNGSVLTADPGESFADALRDRVHGEPKAEQPSAPVSMMPLLMALTLVFLTFEGLMANKFYRRTASDAPGAAEPERTPS